MALNSSLAVRFISLLFLMMFSEQKVDSMFLEVDWRGLANIYLNQYVCNMSL